MSATDRLQAATAYARTLWLGQRLSSRERIERYQQHATARLVADARATVPFYRALGSDFASLPVIDKAVQQARFAGFNRAAVPLDAVVAALAAGQESVDGLHVGQSTGTSGNRGRYVISPAERYAWLGTIVAKTMPEALWRPRRVALALPGFSSLYRSAPRGSRVALAFYDLALGVDAWRDDLIRFAPHAIVAPPKALRRLAEAGGIAGVQAFSGAEILDPLDRAAIEAATARPVREIYMATEGLFGVGCRHGTLHLAEDVVRFEWECAIGNTLVTPIVTDLVRRVQPMIRYRMNDLLELSDAPCPCGSAFQAVARVHGRTDDLFVFATPAGAIAATPDILRNAVVDAHPAIDDFRLLQKLDGSIVLTLADSAPPAAMTAAIASLGRALTRLGATASIMGERGIALRFDRKLRRVERERAQ